MPGPGTDSRQWFGDRGRRGHWTPIGSVEPDPLVRGYQLMVPELPGTGNESDDYRKGVPAKAGRKVPDQPHSAPL